ncbi:two-component system, chemotaxis family, response regulator CheB [Cohnella sp. OV330]|uniref:protein-glutamate methylesterase/protein-glutamine glutaminase n=1 Tax=Cohnella sp. OV330 TaxID=1855288 RepID=UPI0008ECC91F|nr:chemotaxis protein CheB [Cohnella sp. OV330]SFB57279.1 two-component system, chemotaxis family, response regulator CheB [Cohnella sp. OV330]
MKAFTVLVVDDSPFMRKLVGDLVAGDAAFEVVGTAADGADAVRQVRELRPDIAVMDLEMPEINGLEALKRIMAECPTPVIMMSAVTDRGTRDTIRALQYGAFDFVRKPDGALKLDVSHMGETLIEKLHIARELLASGELRLRRMTAEGAEAMVIQADAEPSPDRTDMEPKAPPGEVAETSAPLYIENQEPEHSASRALDRETHESAAEQAGLGPNRRLSNGAAAQEETAASIDRPAASGKSLSEIPSARRTTPKPLTPAKDKYDRKSRLPEMAGLAGKSAAEPSAPVANSSKSPKPIPPDPALKRPQPDKPPKAPLPSAPRQTESFTDIVAIGTSTGGPRALHEVLSAIPASFPAPILIVQHMPPKFTHSLAQRLDSCSAIEVREAADGDRVLPGQAYLAPGGKHLKLIKEAGGGYKIGLTEEDPVSGHRPSVDVMFGSLVGRRELRRHAVLMTGMGSDGAKAMKALREDGAATLIAEAEETCVVYGMPRSAMECGAAQTALPLHRIAPELVKSVEKPKAKQL